MNRERFCKAFVYLLWFSLFCGSALAQNSLLLPHRNNQANRLFGEKKYEEALEIYLELYEKAPDDMELAYNIANAYQALGDHEKAEYFYQKTFTSNHQEAQQNALFNSGLLAMKTQNAETAVDRFVSYLQQNPTDQEAKRNLELALRMLEQQKKQPQENQQQGDEGDDKQDSQNQNNKNGQDQQNQQNQDGQDQNQPQNSENDNNQNQPQDSKSDSESNPQQDQGQGEQGEKDQRQQNPSEKNENQDKQEQNQDQQSPEQDQQNQQQQDPSQSGQGSDTKQQAGQGKKDPKKEQVKEQILNALKEQEAQQHKEFLLRKSSKGQRKSKDW